MNYETLRKKFLAFRRAKGNKAAKNLIQAHGGDDGILASVPESNRSKLAEAFEQAAANPERPDVPPRAFGEAGSPPIVRSQDDYARELNAMSQRVWDKFNHPPKRENDQ